MKRAILLGFVFLLCFSFVSADEWILNDTTIQGLNIQGSNGFFGHTDVFDIDGTYYAILSQQWGASSAVNPKGYKWNGTQWVSHSAILSGLPIPEISGSPGSNCVVIPHEIWKPYDTLNLLQYDCNDNDFDGFQWNGTAWISNTTIDSGLGTFGWSAPDIFYYDDKWNLIIGRDTGSYTGFQWNGTAWISNTTIVNGLVDLGVFYQYSQSQTYEKNGNLYLITSAGTNAFSSQGYILGFEWNGTGWIENNDTFSGLPENGFVNKHLVFDIFQDEYAISMIVYEPYLPANGFFNEQYLYETISVPNFIVFNDAYNFVYDSQNTYFNITLVENAGIIGTCNPSSYQIFFQPNSSTKGTESCTFLFEKYDQFAGNVAENIIVDIQTINLSDFVSVTSPGSAGTSSIDEPEPIIEYEFVQNISYNEFLRITEELFLGDKIKVIMEPKEIEIQTENQNDRFDLAVLPGQQISKYFTIRNTGEEDLNFKISCVGDFCKNVILSKSTAEITAGNERQIDMVVNVPEDVSSEEVFSFAIIVEDTKDSSFKASLPVKITVDEFLGRFSNIFSIERMFRSGIRLTENFYIPNFVLLFAISILSFAIMSIAYNFSGRNAVFNIFRYLVTVISMAVFLLFL